MEALSIQQPWAWLIVNGYKDIENREWPTKKRGVFLVHTGQKFDRDGYNWIRQTFPEIPLPKPEEYPRGGIVGQASITDCVTSSPSKWFFGKFGFVLTDASPCEFRSYKGELKFFRVKEPPATENTGAITQAIIKLTGSIGAAETLLDALQNCPDGIYRPKTARGLHRLIQLGFLSADYAAGIITVQRDKIVNALSAVGVQHA